jgi:hypothetical protein
MISYFVSTINASFSVINRIRVVIFVIFIDSHTGSWSAIVGPRAPFVRDPRFLGQGKAV